MANISPSSIFKKTVDRLSSVCLGGGRVSLQLRRYSTQKRGEKDLYDHRERSGREMLLINASIFSFGCYKRRYHG